jgi:metal-sulfur cluster biosynthetic enzyme
LEDLPFPTASADGIDKGRDDMGDGGIATEVDRGVKTILGSITDPCSRVAGVQLSLLEMGLVRSINYDAGSVQIVLGLTSPACYAVPAFHREIEARVLRLSGVAAVDIRFEVNFEWTEDAMTDTARGKLRLTRAGRRTRRSPAREGHE